VWASAAAGPRATRGFPFQPRITAADCSRGLQPRITAADCSRGLQPRITRISRIRLRISARITRIASVYDIILNIVDSGMAVRRAIEAPGFPIGRDPVERDVARMQIEDRIPRSILDPRRSHAPAKPGSWRERVGVAEMRGTGGLIWLHRTSSPT
jgi:hypothetical protein